MFLAVAQFAAYADNEYGTVFLADSVLTTFRFQVRIELA